MSKCNKIEYVDKLQRYHKHTSYCVTKSVSEAVEYIWRINHFWKLYPAINILYSGIFPEKPKYRITIKIARHNTNQSEDLIQIYLVLFNYKKETILYDVQVSNEVAEKVHREYCLLPVLTTDAVKETMVLLKSFTYKDMKESSDDELLVIYIKLMTYTSITHYTIHYTTFRKIKPLPIIHQDNLTDFIFEKNSKSPVITFVVDDNRLYMRKDVLCSSSKYFNMLLAEQTNLQMNITDVSYETFKQMLSFIVTGVMPNSNAPLDEFKNLLALAEKYNIQDLKEACEEYFVYKITVANAAEIMLIALSYNAEALKIYAASFIKLHLETIAFTPYFQKLLHNHLKEIVNSIACCKILKTNTMLRTRI